MRTCKICGEEKSLDEFYSNGRFKRAECKPCTRLKQTSAKFNLTAEQLLSMYKEQNYCCAICKQPCDVYENLSVDHDHNCCPSKAKSCGKCIRGLLCAHCNHAIGLFKDDVDLLERAIQYLTT